MVLKCGECWATMDDPREGLQYEFDKISKMACLKFPNERPVARAISL
jgi:hypothetical protein